MYDAMDATQICLCPVEHVIHHTVQDLALCIMLYVHTFMETHTHTQVNEAFRSQFETWVGDHPQVQLVSDGSHSNEERLGAVGCVDLAVRHFQVQDDLIVIGG